MSNLVISAGVVRGAPAIHFSAVVVSSAARRGASVCIPTIMVSAPCREVGDQGLDGLHNVVHDIHKYINGMLLQKREELLLNK